MIVGQLNQLCVVDNCLIHDGRVYERLTDHTHKYRVIFNEDDYDYVEDEVLINELDDLI